jgi:hypothetical protein
VATFSKEGIVTIWDTNTLLNQLCTVNPLDSDMLTSSNIEGATLKDIVFLPPRTSYSEEKDDCIFASLVAGSNKLLLNL